VLCIRLITSRNPGDRPEFTEAIAAELIAAPSAQAFLCSAAGEFPVTGSSY